MKSLIPVNFVILIILEPKWWRERGRNGHGQASKCWHKLMLACLRFDEVMINSEWNRMSRCQFHPNITKPVTVHSKLVMTRGKSCVSIEKCSPIPPQPASIAVAGLLAPHSTPLLFHLPNNQDRGLTGMGSAVLHCNLQH